MMLATPAGITTPTDERLADSSRVVVVMPAYNAARTLRTVYDELPRSQIAEIILVDDGSHDDTLEIARELGLRVFAHSQNFGYGANQKTCYTEALKIGAEIIVMVHPDYQYDPRLVPQIIQPILDHRADVVFGSRMIGVSAHKQGMPWWKYVANIVLTKVENMTFGLHLSEFHTGYRAYRRTALERVNFLINSDSFIFDQEIVAQFVECGLTFGEIGVPTRYFPEASSLSFRASVLYGLEILRLVLRYALHRTGLWHSAQFTCYSARYQELQ
jgi:glycosyltransferase involved in cell wall biosynthesis